MVPNNKAVGKNSALIGELFELIENRETGGGFDVPSDGSEFVVGSWHGQTLYCREYSVDVASAVSSTILTAGFRNTGNFLYAYGTFLNNADNSVRQIPFFNTSSVIGYINLLASGDLVFASGVGLGGHLTAYVFYCKL